MLLSPTQNSFVASCSQKSDLKGLRELSKGLLHWIQLNGRSIASDGSPLWQVGKTKIFMKDKLQTEAERLAAAAWSQYATTITKHWRRYRMQTKYKRMKEVFTYLQAQAKFVIYRSFFQSYIRPRQLACVKIQALWKGFKLRRAWRYRIESGRKIQRALIRGRMVIRLRALAKRHADDIPLTLDEWELGCASFADCRRRDESATIFFGTASSMERPCSNPPAENRDKMKPSREKVLMAQIDEIENKMQIPQPLPDGEEQQSDSGHEKRQRPSKFHDQEASTSHSKCAIKAVISKLEKRVKENRQLHEKIIELQKQQTVLEVN